MKYLVTGGCGAIGAPLVKALIGEGHKVRVLDNCSRGKHHRLKDVDCEIWLGSICHANFVRECVKGVDSVIHLAAINGTRNFYERPHDVLAVGIKGAVNVMDACITEGVKEILVASSSEVYQSPTVIPTPEEIPLVVPDPRNPRYTYGGTKILTELMALHYGAGHFTRRLIARPHNVYGPDMGEDHVIPQFIRRMQVIGDEMTPFPIQGDGTQQRAFCYIDDAVSGILTVLKHGKDREIYNVGDNYNLIGMGALSHLLATIMNKYIRVESSGDAPFGEAHTRCPSVKKLKGLGWQSKTDPIEGLKATVKWYLENPA